MGKPKTQRTDELRQTARRYVIAEEAQNHIEQHNFDRLVAQGVIIRGGLQKRRYPQGGRQCFNHNVLRHFYSFCKVLR